jgi:hypothetical protein
LLSFRSSSRIWAELHEKAFRRLGGSTQLQLSLQFLHQLSQYFLGFSLHWAQRFRPLRFLFLLDGRLAILLQGSISLSFGIALRVL